MVDKVPLAPRPAVVGLIGGVALCQFWPRTEFEISFAMATDRIDTFGMATGALDTELEAVYFLDFLTGQLTAVVVGKQGGYLRYAPGRRGQGPPG